MNCSLKSTGFSFHVRHSSCSLSLSLSSPTGVNKCTVSLSYILKSAISAGPVSSGLWFNAVTYLSLPSENSTVIFLETRRLESGSHYYEFIPSSLEFFLDLSVSCSSLLCMKLVCVLLPSHGGLLMFVASFLCLGVLAAVSIEIGV